MIRHYFFEKIDTHYGSGIVDDVCRFYGNPSSGAGWGMSALSIKYVINGNGVGTGGEHSDENWNGDGRDEY